MQCWHQIEPVRGSWSSFAAKVSGLSVAPIQRHKGLDFAAKIGRHAHGLVAEIVELHFEDGDNAL